MLSYTFKFILGSPGKRLPQHLACCLISPFSQHRQELEQDCSARVENLFRLQGDARSATRKGNPMIDALQSVAPSVSLGRDAISTQFQSALFISSVTGVSRSDRFLLLLSLILFYNLIYGAFLSLPGKKTREDARENPRKISGSSISLETMFRSLYMVTKYSLLEMYTLLYTSSCYSYNYT